MSPACRLLASPNCTAYTVCPTRIDAVEKTMERISIQPDRTIRTWTQKPLFDLLEWSLRAHIFDHNVQKLESPIICDCSLAVLDKPVQMLRP